MARTARTYRLTALAVRKYANDPRMTAPLHDGGGLYLRKRGASLTWVLRLTDPANGSQQWHRLFPDNPSGTYPHKSLADARQEAHRLWTTRSGGIDPRAERRRDIEARQTAESSRRAALERRVSIRALFERWAAVDLAPRLTADGRRLGRKDGGSSTRALFERRVFPRLGHSAVEDVRRGDLLTLLDGAKAEGKLRTANVLLSDLKQMFRFALARDVVQRNPLDTVNKRDVGGPSVERDRVLSIGEVRQLSDALVPSELQTRFVAGVWLILSTGVRVGELLGATWADADQDSEDLRTIGDQADVKVGFVDLARGTWHIPVTKNQRSHTIHLSDFAREQFKQLEALRKSRSDTTPSLSPWVFSNDSGDGPVGVKSLGKQLSDRQRDAKGPLRGRSKSTTSLSMPGGRWTAHDLRRTAATFMAALGVSGDVIDECLNHVIESRVRRTYIRDRRIVQQRQAFDALGKFLDGLVQANSPTSSRSTRPLSALAGRFTLPRDASVAL
jgi:integrase